MEHQPFKLSATFPAPGEPDMDWTEPFLERGTTVQFSGILNSEDIPVKRAYVKDEVLHIEVEVDNIQ